MQIGQQCLWPNCPPLRKIQSQHCGKWKCQWQYTVLHLGVSTYWQHRYNTPEWKLPLHIVVCNDEQIFTQNVTHLWKSTCNYSIF
jgi:hypothetical protein